MRIRFVGGVLLLLVCPAMLGAQGRIYLQDVSPELYGTVRYGWDLGVDTPVSSLTPDGFQTVGELIAAPFLDFSGVPMGVEAASTTVPINAQETCNFDACGYNPGGAHPERTLGREDRNFDDPGNLVITNAVSEMEIRPGDPVPNATIWLRGGAQNEGKQGALGDGESRFCYVGDGGEPRSESPLWRFTRQDAEGWYLQPGDSWVTGPFQCEQNVYNQVCGEPGFLDRIWTAACGDHPGTQSGEVLGEATVVIPSGHRVDTLVVRTVADFCVWALDVDCAPLFKVDEVRQVVYLWVNRELGTVVRLMSETRATDLTSWTAVAETDIKFGLYPPLDIQATDVGNDWVEITWDPGRYTHRIDGYKVYWGTESADTVPYPFDSERNPAQVAFNGTSAVISGLDPDTRYHFTVTSQSVFTDPSSGIVTGYESTLYPRQAFGSPDTAYPVEVVQRTLDPNSCAPQVEPERLLLAKQTDLQVAFCWEAVTDPCLSGYRLWESDGAESDTGYTVLQDTPDNETCWTGDVGNRYYLVTAEGRGGGGPWGHYAR